MLKGKRLDKLEEYLTPRQAAMMWLQNANKSSSFREYFKSLRGQVQVFRPFFSLAAGVEQLVRRNMKGEPKKTVAGAVKQALLDYCFLIKLHHQANIRLMEEDSVWKAALGALGEKLQAILWEMRFKDVIETLSIPVSFPPQVEEDTRIWKAVFGPLLAAMYAFREAGAFVSRNYFGGEDVLFPDLIHGLGDWIRSSETLAGIFNEVVARRPEDNIELTRLQLRNEKEMKHLVSGWVQVARADALGAMGDNLAALDLVERSL